MSNGVNPLASPDPVTTDWVPIGPPGPGVPPAGTTGQALIKKTATDYDLQWGNAATVTGYGTTLPASPYDGQEYVLVDSTTNPSWQWRFRYNAASTSAYKWEFIGGSAATGYADAGLAVSTPSAWAAFATPTITIPRNGEYNVSWGAGNLNENSTSLWVGIGIWVSGGLIATTDTYQNCNPGSNNMSVARPDFGPVVFTAAQVLQVAGLASGAVTAGKRALVVTPRRVS